MKTKNILYKKGNNARNVSKAQIHYTHFSIYADLIYAFLELHGCRINTIF
jgi:hypothetical protein